MTDADTDTDERFDAVAVVKAVDPVGNGVGFSVGTPPQAGTRLTDSIEEAVEISGYMDIILEQVRDMGVSESQYADVQPLERRREDRDPEATYTVTVARVLVDTDYAEDDPEAVQVLRTDEAITRMED